MFLFVNYYVKYFFLHNVLISFLQFYYRIASYIQKLGSTEASLVL